MKTEKNESQNTRTRRIRYPGIVGDARRLGVHRMTLYKMLRGYPGYDALKTLRRRYDALQKAKGGAR